MKNLRVRYKILKASIRLEELKFNLEDKFGTDKFNDLDFEYLLLTRYIKRLKKLLK